MHAIHRKILEVAQEQYEAEGRRTYSVLVAATGLSVDGLRNRLGHLRQMGVIDWVVDKKQRPRKPRPEPKAGPSHNDEKYRGDEAIRKQVLAEGLAAMGDGRAEIDDPREHGILAVPRSLPREKASEDLAEECRRMFRHWRGVRRRQRWGSTRKAVAA